ncbi:MAG: GNAT family N-acetyltransferase [Oceanococcus sp.]
MNKFNIRAATLEDADEIARIYNHYIDNSVSTFEEERVTAAIMRLRMAELLEPTRPWLVAEEAGLVLGYAYAGTWKGRSAYRYTVETTVYLDHQCPGRGIGRALYTQLLTQLRAAGMHMAIGCISLPNAASVGLHESLGFQLVGTFSQVGFKHDRWVDIGYWQLEL